MRKFGGLIQFITIYTSAHKIQSLICKSTHVFFMAYCWMLPFISPDATIRHLKYTRDGPAANCCVWGVTATIIGRQTFIWSEHVICSLQVLFLAPFADWLLCIAVPINHSTSPSMPCTFLQRLLDCNSCTSSLLPMLVHLPTVDDDLIFDAPIKPIWPRWRPNRKYSNVVYIEL